MSVRLKLTEPLKHKLSSYAANRDQPEDKAAEHLLRRALASIPSNLTRAEARLDEAGIVDAGSSAEGTPYVQLDNGRLFYGHPSQTRYTLLYYLCKDTTPACIKPESYGLGVETVRLYRRAHRYRWFPAANSGAVVVQAGAYVGLKSIGFADHLGPKGKVIAIELDDRNYQLLRRNVEANGLTDRILTYHCGVWDRHGHIPYSGRGWMQNTLTGLDGRSYPQRGLSEVVPLDDLLDRSGIDAVDFLNIQVNGAEVEALMGLDRWFTRTHIIRIASYYTRDGRPIADDVVALLEQRGARILQRTPDGKVTCSTR